MDERNRNSKPAVHFMCMACGRPIKGRVYLQGGQPNYRVHRHCLTVIERPTKKEQ